MKPLSISLCVAVVLAVLLLQAECRTEQEECYYKCMRRLFSCKRSSSPGPCCAPFIECAVVKCKYTKPKCFGQKRGSWNKRFVTDYDSAESMEYPNLFLQ